MKNKFAIYTTLMVIVAVVALTIALNRPYIPASFVMDGNIFSATVDNGATLLLNLQNDNNRNEWSIIQEPACFASDYSSITENSTEFHIIPLNHGEGVMEFQCVLGDGRVEKYELTLSISRHQKTHLQIDSVSFMRKDDLNALEDMQKIESEKVYIEEYLENTSDSPISIPVVEGQASSDNDILDCYDFEKSVSDTDVYKLFEDKSNKVSAVINDKDNRTVTITSRASALLDDLANVCLQSYISKEMPDLSRFYDLSNSIRQENRLLTEVYFYEKTLVKANNVASFDYSVDIADVKPLSDNVDEIIFYLRKTLHTDEGDEDSGGWFIIRAAASSEGYKILDLWAQDYEYEMVQNRIKTDYLEKNIPLDRERLLKETKKKIDDATK